MHFLREGLFKQVAVAKKELPPSAALSGSQDAAQAAMKEGELCVSNLSKPDG